MTNDGGSLSASLYMLDQKLKNSSGRIMIFLVLELCLSQRPKITKKSCTCKISSSYYKKSCPKYSEICYLSS